MHKIHEALRSIFGNVGTAAVYAAFICLLSPAALRAELTYGDFTYTVSGTDVTITGYTGSDASVTIPATIDGNPVTAIGASAFYNCDSLTGISIPASVTAIGASAFRDCSGLTN
ncbi:MAG TPA: leucine-rich repeat protein, partial [Opitutales bacterium]|nr:leucine-rich repeat protein [Opitutales bacterium]